MRPVDASGAGISAHLDSFRRAAGRISREAPGGDLARDLVQTGVDQRGVEANVKAMRAADEMVGTLIDIVA